jgi:hypothetical protein
MSEGTTFYRCALCHGVVSKWDIDKGGCAKCGGTKISPTNLSFFEKVKQIVRRPAVWRW